MSIEQSLERIASALEQIAAGKTAGCDAPPPAPRKAGRPPKVEAPAAPAVEADPLADEPAAPAVSQEEVHKALRAYMDKNGIDKTKALMIKHGAAAAKPVLTSIPVANYGALMAEIAS